MTTANSPLRVLKAQANEIAAKLKALEGGMITRVKDSITFGVVMDDKVLKIDMPWSTIRENSEAGIAEYILKHMQEARDAVH